MAIGYVREARPDEAGDIARIQMVTWRTAYRRLLPARILDQLDQEWMARRWRDAVEAPPSPRHRVLVAVEQAAAHSPLVGFAASGPVDAQVLAPGEGPPDEDPPGENPPGEDPLGGDAVAVTDLLVEPRWGRRGHGSRLLAASVDQWREDGFSTALAWAYEADPATRRFLASAGWEPDGARRALDVDDLLVPQLRYHTRLDLTPEP